MNKKAFSLLEILFVMSLISILTGIGVVYFKDSLSSSKLNELNSDMITAITYTNKLVTKTYDYSSINNGDYKDNSLNGFSDNLFGEIYLPLHFSVNINYTAITCDNGEAGFKLVGTSGQVKDIKSLEFDSCLSLKIIKIDL